MVISEDLKTNSNISIKFNNKIVFLIKILDVKNNNYQFEFIINKVFPEQVKKQYVLTRLELETFIQNYYRAFTGES